MKYTSVLDLHTHTVASGHAYCTIPEMAAAAAGKGLEILGITEHAPAMPGTCHNFYFHNLKVVSRELHGIRLLLGTELNILDSDGQVEPGSRAENTEAYLNVMKNPYVNIIGHPDDGRYEIDYPALVQGAREYGKVLELNNHSLEPSCFRQGAKENDTEMLKLCMKYQVPVVMSSDAHFDSAINEFESARSLLEELDFPEELVLNRSAEALKPFVNRKF